MTPSHILALLVAFTSIVAAIAILFETPFQLPDEPVERRRAWRLLLVSLLLVSDSLIIGSLL